MRLPPTVAGGAPSGEQVRPNSPPIEPGAGPFRDDPDRPRWILPRWTAIPVSPATFLNARPLPAIEPLEVAGARWILELGRRPVLSEHRAPDGLRTPSRVAVSERPFISELMADLLRRDFTGEITPHTLGLPRGAFILPSRLTGLFQEKELASLRDEGAPLGLVRRYALAEILAEATDESGRFDLARFRGTYGPGEAEALIGWIGRRPRGARLAAHERAPFEIRPLIDENWWSGRPFGSPFPNLLRAIEGEQTWRRRSPMSLVDDVVDRWGPPHDEDFVMAVEHILGSNATPSAARRFGRIGKGYSASTPVFVYESMKNRVRGGAMDQYMVTGLDGKSLLDEAALGLGEHLPPGFERERLAESLVNDGLHRGRRRPFHHFQVIDSGARALLEFEDLLRTFPPEKAGFTDRTEFIRAASGVEHTRDGARKLREADLSFPVVNAAESPVKLNMVAPLIAWSIVEEVARELDDLRVQGIDVPRRALVVGYGSTGRHLAPLLTEAGFSVVVKDVDAAARASAEGAGFEVISSVPEGLEIGLVIGCVGLPSLSFEELMRLPTGTVLFSGSSSNKEFPFLKEDGWTLEPHGRLRFVERPMARFRARDIQVGTPTVANFMPWNRVARLGEHELLLVRSLFPVNLTGHPDPLSPEIAQLIRGLMVLASFEARQLPPGTRGLVELDREGQRFIADRYMELVRALEPPLPAPVLDRLEREHQRTQAELKR